MPYKSEAQRRFFNSEKGKEIIGKKEVEKWNEESKGLDLPEKVDDAYKMSFIAHKENKGSLIQNPNGVYVVIDFSKPDNNNVIYRGHDKNEAIKQYNKMTKDSLNINPNKYYYSTNPRLPKKKGFEIKGSDIIESAKKAGYNVYSMNQKTLKKTPLSFEDWFNNQHMKNWVEVKDAVDPIQVFEDIMLKYMPNKDKVKREITIKYNGHRGEEEWDKAYREFKKSQNLDSVEKLKIQEKIEELEKELDYAEDHNNPGKAIQIGKELKRLREQMKMMKDAMPIKTRYGTVSLTNESIMNLVNKGYEHLGNEKVNGQWYEIWNAPKRGNAKVAIKGEDSKMVDASYNKFANEKDKEYLKDALKEMRRYESNWSFMSAKEKKNIAPGGLKELKEQIKYADDRLKQLGSKDSLGERIYTKGDVEVKDASTHAVVTTAKNILSDLGYNNSVGKYDKVIMGVRSTLGQTLVPEDDPKFKPMIEKEVKRLLVKYNLDSKSTKDSEQEYSFSIKCGADMKKVKVTAATYREALDKVKQEAIKFKGNKVKSKFDNNKLSTRDN